MWGFAASADESVAANPTGCRKKVFLFLPAYGRLNKIIVLNKEIKYCSMVYVLQRRGYE